MDPLQVAVCSVAPDPTVQEVPSALHHEKSASQDINEQLPNQSVWEPPQCDSPSNASWLSKDVVAFFLLGLLIALPTMAITTAANDMFKGVTGVFGVCLSVAAAITSFTTPLLLHYLHSDVRMAIAFTGSVLSFVICTVSRDNVAGPAIGTMIAGFVYAFGTNSYLAAAAFYDRRTVVSFSVGSGFSTLVGPGVYIGITQGLHGDWRKTLLIFLVFPILQPLTWWLLLSKAPRQLVEQTRRDSLLRSRKGNSETTSTSQSDEEQSRDSSLQLNTGFGAGRTRISLFVKTLLPKYVLPLSLCTLGAMFNLGGLSPTFQQLNTFRQSPQGQLNYEIDFLAYGFGQFLFSSIAIVYSMQLIYAWAAGMLTLVVIGIIQLFYPFLTYYGVWVIFMFFTGGIVGGSVTNTNQKVADDYEKAGESHEVRSFAMSYSGLGNFTGDALGGVLAIVTETLAAKHLPVRHH